VVTQGQFLRAAGLELWPDGTRSGRYQFRHALYHQVCYERLGVAQRVHLHGQIAARLEAGYGTQARTRAAELAVHYARGVEPARSLVYRRYAGETALRRYAYPEALAHCTAGIETYTTLPPTPTLTSDALALSLTLGATRLATEGSASPAVEQAYRHAYVLAQELGDTSQMFPALYGLGSYYRVRAEFGTSYELMQRLMQVAQNAADPALLLMAHFALGGMLRYWRGGLVQARWHLEQSLALYDPAQHGTLASRYGLYPQVSSLANLATLLRQLGYPEQARQRSHEAVTLAQAAGSPFDVTVALAYDALLLQMCHALPQAQAQSEAVLALAAQHGFAHWMHSCDVLHGWGLAIQGQAGEGIGHIRRGLERLSAMGVRLMRPYLLGLLAQAYQRAGQVDAGLATLAEAVRLIQVTEESVIIAPLSILQGDLLLMQAGTAAAMPQAEACWQQALAVARRHQTKAWELRAALRLSQLWHRQGQGTKARQFLASLYGWFTEGLDTPDLQEAKAVLHALA